MKCRLHPKGHLPFTGPQKGRWRMDEKSSRFYCPVYCEKIMEARHEKELERSYVQRFGERKGRMILAILRGGEKK